MCWSVTFPFEIKLILVKGGILYKSEKCVCSAMKSKKIDNLFKDLYVAWS